LIRLCKILAKSADGKKAVCIDKQNEEEILSYVNQSPRHLKKFRHILQLILEGHKNTNLYDKEDINEKSKNITAMKFFKGQENDRIYCVEQKADGIYIIVAVEVYEKKKSQKITKKEIPVINKIANYEYKIEEYRH
jgi:hypothetical protein